LVALEGSASWGNTLVTALLHDQNWTIPFGLIVQSLWITTFCFCHFIGLLNLIFSISKLSSFCGHLGFETFKAFPSDDASVVVILQFKKKGLFRKYFFTLCSFALSDQVYLTRNK